MHSLVWLSNSPLCLCTPVFTAALFTTARMWKQPRCPSRDEWEKKLWYIYTMEYYSAIKRSAFESVLTRWMNLELIVQWSKSEKQISCIETGLVIHFTYDNIHVSMPFSHFIPPLPSPTESKRLFYTSVSLSLSHIQGYHYHLSKLL